MFLDPFQVVTHFLRKKNCRRTICPPGEITHETACTSCKTTIESQEPIDYLLLKFPKEDHNEDCTVESLIKHLLQEERLEGRECSCSEKRTSGIRNSTITNFPSFMCILLCRNIGDDKITISSAVEFPAFGFNINGDDMRYDLSATVHYKQTKDGNGHYTTISRSQDLQSQRWFMYDDETVSISTFTNMNNTVKRGYMKTAAILFYVSQSIIETRIKNANTIDLIEGGKEQAQMYPTRRLTALTSMARRATQTAAAYDGGYTTTSRCSTRGQEGSVMRGHEGGATRGSTATSRRKTTRGWCSERTTRGRTQQPDGAMRQRKGGVVRG